MTLPTLSRAVVALLTGLTLLAVDSTCFCQDRAELADFADESPASEGPMTLTQAALMQPAPAQTTQPAAPTLPTLRQPGPLRAPSPFATTGAGRGMLLSSVFGSTGTAVARRRLTRVPDMFGDSFIPGGRLSVQQVVGTVGIGAGLDLPVAAGTSHLMIGENNKAVPVDRVYFNYNHFDDAFENRITQDDTTDLLPADVLRNDADLDRYTFGVEKTFWQGRGSMELRVPFAGGNELSVTGPFEPVAVGGGDFGNISLIAKLLLWAADDVALSSGVGLELPTGDDAVATIGPNRYRYENDSYRIHPFLSLLSDYDSGFFFNGFAQLDLTANGNRLWSAGELGRFNDQHLLRLDASWGYHLCRPRRTRLIHDVAAVVELHYVTSLVDSDNLLFVVPFDRVVTMSNRYGQMDILNLSAGLHTQLGEDSLVRVGCAFPLREEDRVFDGELMIQLTQRF